MLARFLRNKGTDLAPWSDWCRDFEYRYLKKKYGFARVPQAQISGVDVAQMFIQREKFVSTWIFFSKCSAVCNVIYSATTFAHNYVAVNQLLYKPRFYSRTTISTYY